MNSTLPLTKALVAQFRNVIDLYILHRNGNKILVARKWPRKPKATDKRFAKTHQASKVTLDSYRRIDVSNISQLRAEMKGCTEYPLDVWRSLNQSLAYQNSSLPIIYKVDSPVFDPESQKWLVTMHHDKGFKVKAIVATSENGKIHASE